MSKPIAVVTSDCHLADRTWSSRPSLEGDSYFSFGQIVKTALDYKVPIIAAGDLIDKQKNESGVVSFLSRMMDLLRDKQEFYYIQGQHEYQETPWLNAISSWPRHIHDTEVEIGGLKVIGFDWSQPDAIAKYLEREKDVDVLVLHQVTEDWMGGITSGEMSFSQVQIDGAVIIGDYHLISDVETHIGARGQQISVLSPGSTCMQSISEPPAKQLWLLHDDLTFEPKKLATRIVLKPPTLYGEEDMTSFLGGLKDQIDKAWDKAKRLEYPEHMQKPIIYVTYYSDIADAYNRLTKVVGDTAHFFYKVKQPAQGQEQEQQRKIREEILEQGLIGALEEVAPDTESARYKLAYRLLNSRNPREEMAKIRSKILKVSS